MSPLQRRILVEKLSHSPQERLYKIFRPVNDLSCWR